LYHAPAGNYGAVLDLGTPRQDEARGLARRESFAEDLRLLYVALTRAKHRCYFVWGAINQAEKSAPAWLLHPPPAHDAGLEQLQTHVKGLSEAAMWADIERLAAESQGAIVVERLAESFGGESYRSADTSSEMLYAREFRGSVPAAWRVTSFTGLTSGVSSDQPDYDASARGFELPEIPRHTRDIFSFPRGARAGRALHAIFEQLDFVQHDLQSLTSLTAQSLAAHGISSEWTEVVVGHVARVLDTPLDRQGRIQLRGIPNERRLNELEFHFPIARIDPRSLQRVMGGFISLPEAIRTEDNLNFSPVHGFMKGFIDLVFECDRKFYVVDYKSNWLGPTPEDYQATRLAAAMTEEGYTLQYLLYTVAVHRYLRSRVPDYRYNAHFGGVFYLFLRGMDPAFGPECGVFRDRPAEALIEALDGYFAGGHAHV
jgi:exodeoxyribonuclease V beta subunit